MPAARTYEPLATTTLSSTATSYTFNSISGSYTDLVLIAMARTDRNEQSGRPSDLIKITVNGSTTNYSYTFLGSNSSSAISYRESNISNLPLAVIPGAQSNAGEYSTAIFQFQSYSNSTTNKTILCKSGNPTSVTGGNIYMGAAVGLWRETTAISSITLAPLVGPNFVSGCTFTLYGITAA